jgi:hypothetical protein
MVAQFEKRLETHLSELREVSPDFVETSNPKETKPNEDAILDNIKRRQLYSMFSLLA